MSCYLHSDQNTSMRYWTPPRDTRKGLMLALLNVEGMQESLPDLALMLDTGLNMPKPAYLDVLAHTETFENKNGSNVYSRVKKYTWYGKPSQKPVTSLGPRQGLGFWIKNRIIHKVSIMEPNDKHDNILWIRIISKTDILYIAVTYVPFDDVTPEHQAEALEIFKILKLNTQELQSSGTVIITGDMNARIPGITGDNGLKQKIQKWSVTTESTKRY
jgi:exonuclease III